IDETRRDPLSANIRDGAAKSPDLQRLRRQNPRDGLAANGESPAIAKPVRPFHRRVECGDIRIHPQPIGVHRCPTRCWNDSPKAESISGVTPQKRFNSRYSATSVGSPEVSPWTERIIRLRAVCSVLTNSTTSVR